MRCGKEINLVITGEDTELDRTVLEAIDDPLIHIIRNALDHGLRIPKNDLKRKGPKEQLRLRQGMRKTMCWWK